MFDFILKWVAPRAWQDRQEQLQALDEALDAWTLETEDTIELRSIPQEDQFVLHTPSRLKLPSL